MEDATWAHTAFVQEIFGAADGAYVGRWLASALGADQLIDAGVSKKPDGLIVSLPDAGALDKSITAAVSAGIPVVSINSGSGIRLMGVPKERLGVGFCKAP